jgi:hypothetical protein
MKYNEMDTCIFCAELENLSHKFTNLLWGLQHIEKDADGGIRRRVTLERYRCTFYIDTKMQVRQNSTYPDPGYPDRLGPSVKFVENSTKQTSLQITGYRIKYSTV